MSRERTHTMDSAASYASSTGLRERANTAGSIRSVHSNEGQGGVDGGGDDTSAEFSSMRIMSPRQKRVSFSTKNNYTTTPTPPFGISSSTKTNRQLRNIVEFLERQRVPAPLYRHARRLWRRLTSRSGASSAATSSSSSSLDADVYEDSVFWIQGLDRVVFGTSSAAEVIRLVGVQPPRYLWYMVSGFVCDIIQLCMDVILSTYVIDDASVCWATTFFLSVIFRHTSHRYLVFGDYVGGYWASLGRMYGGYSIIIVLSTIFNILMTRVATFSHYVAWIMTLLWTGIANYFILKKLWSFGGNK